MISAVEVFFIRCDRNLDDLVEVALFDAEREHQEYRMNAMIRRDGKIRSPRPFSSESCYCGLIMEQLVFKGIPFSIKYSPSSNVGYSIRLNGITYASNSLPEALSKAVAANWVQNGKKIFDD